MIDLINNFSTIGRLDSDPFELKIQKSFLVFLAVFMSCGGVLWGSITLYHGLVFQSSIPIGYVVLSFLNMIYFKISKNFKYVRFFQVLISLILPFLFQSTLGGFFPSGLISLWAILALVASLSFHDLSSSFLWLGLFVVGLLLTASYDDYFFSVKPEILEDKSLLFLVLNVSVISSIFFGLVLYFVENHKSVSTKLKKTYKQMSLLNSVLEENLEDKRQAFVDLQKTQSQLIESEKMASLGVLSAGIGHEINNPLNHIKQGVNTLDNFIEAKNSQAHALVEIINGGVKRMSEIVTSLSHFSRKGVNMDESCDIHEIIENCLVILSNKLKNKVKIVKSFTPDEVILKGNEGRLHQAFLNLLANAEQAILDSGTISISTEFISDEIVIKIADSGTGMDPEAISKIMEPFFTTKEPGVGTGLGLSITNSIIREHKGTILVNSIVGKGSDFRISLPIN